MGDKAVEVLEGELGVQLKEEPPSKPVRLRKPDVQPSKKKKEGASTSPRQVSKKAPKGKARPTSNQNANEDENPFEWFTLNRCILLAVITILVSTGVNSLNETLGELWGMEEVELSAEELALRHSNDTPGDTPEETESSLWNSLFSWSWGSQHDCGTNDNCDADDTVDEDDGYDYDYYDYVDALEDDDNADDDAIRNNDDNNDAVDDDDDDDDDNNGDDGDDGPKRKSRKNVARKREVHSESEREEHKVKRRRRPSREAERVPHQG